MGETARGGHTEHAPTHWIDGSSVAASGEETTVNRSRAPGWLGMLPNRPGVRGVRMYSAPARLKGKSGLRTGETVLVFDRH